jgi:hypothetical protein
MSKQIAIASLVVSVLSAGAMLLLSRPLDQVIWIVAAWVLGAAASVIVGAAQVKRDRRLGWSCVLGGVIMLFFAAMLLPAFQRAKRHRQQPVVNLRFRPPNEVTSADGGWRVLFAIAAQWPAAADFSRSPLT